MKIKYRPEIDGLRTIAVISVIVYHAKIFIGDKHILQGGFIGVDIFFVISGYLITSLILKELELTGKLSLKNFYMRRIRRILPALLIVMLISFLLAWKFLLPSRLIDFSNSIFFSLTFISNFFFHFSGQEYAADSSLLIPLLHTWSLSVEEQYYIIIPIITFVLYKFYKKKILLFFVLAFFISLSLAEGGAKLFPSETFYFLHSRFWQLSAGSVMAYLEIKGFRDNINLKKINLIYPFFGLILIISSLIFFDDDLTPHPSLFTLMPVLGTCLIIWFSSKKEFVTKILSTKLFVGVGLISYSLYLWHYPIFAFARITEFATNNFLLKILLVASIFILSILTFYFIEQPARNKNFKFRFIFAPIITLYLLFGFIILKINLNNGYTARMPPIIEKNLIDWKDEPYVLLKDSKGLTCYDNFECIFNNSSKKKVYLIGDSQIASLGYNLKDRIVEKNYQFIFSTYNGCSYFPGMNKIDRKTEKIDRNCNAQYFLDLEKRLLNEKNSIIVLGGRFPLYLSGYRFNNKEGGVEGGLWNYKYISADKTDLTIEAAFSASINKLIKNNHKIILVYPIPEVGWNVPKKIFLGYIYNQKENNISTSLSVYKERSKSTFELFDSLKGDNIYRIYPHKLFCSLKTGRCLVDNKQEIFYYDDNHTSLFGSKLINNLIIKEIEKIK